MNVKFHQKDPYNRYTPTVNGQKTPVGCVATALLHIVSVNKYPSAINGYSGDWNQILSNPASEESEDILAHWSREIGRICNMNYQPGGSSATNPKAKDFLEQYDRYTNIVLESFNLQHVETMINNEWPVYCTGTNSNKEDGHAWVLDGLFMQKRVIKTFASDGTPLSTKHDYRNLVHCAFGWINRKCDGYYAANCFDTRKGAIVLAPTDSTQTSTYDFSYHTSILTYKFE